MPNSPLESRMAPTTLEANPMVSLSTDDASRIVWRRDPSPWSFVLLTTSVAGLISTAPMSL